MKIDYFWAYFLIMSIIIACSIGYVLVDRMKIVINEASEFCENKTGVFNITISNGETWENINCTYINEHGFDVYSEMVMKSLLEYTT